MRANAETSGPGRLASPRAYHRGSPQRASEATPGEDTMTTKQYLAALKSLGLTPSGKATSEALGLSLRQCQRIAAGEAAVPGPLGKLLQAYLRHGLPEP